MRKFFFSALVYLLCIVLTIKTGTTINAAGGVDNGKDIYVGDKGSIKYVDNFYTGSGGGCNNSDVGTLGMLFAALFMLWRGNKK